MDYLWTDRGYPHAHEALTRGVPRDRSLLRSRVRSPYRGVVRNERHDGPPSEQELESFFQYLHRFCKHELDLFATIEAGDPDYPAFVTITRSPAPGVDQDAYRRP